MAGLIPEQPIVTSEAPRTNLSSQEIAAPIRDLAQALNKTGEAADKIAEPLAERAGEEAGRNSVRTADDGSLIVSDTRNPFIVGPAAERYERAAKITQLAQIQPQVETDLLNLRLQHPNDPGGFSTAAGAYSEKILGGITDPLIKGAVGDVLKTNAAHNERSALVEADSHNTAEALQTYQARLKDMNEQSGTLARQGGTDTPEYAGLAQNRATLWKELQDDPRFKYSKERADLEVAEAYSNDKVQAIVGEAQRKYQTKQNVAEATKFLQDAFWGPGSEKLNLTAAKRDHGVAEGLHALANLTAQDREAISENRQAVTGYLGQLRTNPALFDDIQHGNMVERAKSIGDYKSAADLDTAKSFVPLWSAVKKMNPQQATTALSTMSKGIMPDRADAPKMATIGQQSAEFFAQRGAARFDGMNPEFAGRLRTALEDAEQATGVPTRINSLTRTTDEQAAAYRRYQTGQGGLAAPPGHSRHEVGEAADIAPGKVLDWMHQNADRYGLEFLKGRAGVMDPVHVQMAGGGGLQPGSHIDLAQDNATARLFQSTVKDLREKVAKGADASFASISTAVKNGDALAPGELDNFVTMAVQSGRDDLLDKVRPMLSAADVKAGLPEGTSATAVEAQAAALKASGVDAPHRAVLTDLSEMVQTSAKALKDQPLVEGARKGWFGAIGALNPDNPQAFGAEIADRDKKAGQVEQHDPGHGPINVIAGPEADRIATALTNGKPENATALLGGIAQLSSDNYRATMTAGPIKDAVIGMAGSSDPNRMAAGMTTMDRMWRTDPNAFKATYGETALTKLQAWQGLKDQFSSQEIAERLNKADDPTMIEARRKLGEAAEKELKTDPQGVANQMGSWMDRWVPFVNAQVPADSLQAQQMSVQFTDTYRALRTYGVDADKAKELATKRLGTTWATSSVAGGQFMMHAPETVVNPQTGKLYYPAVNGTQSWMSDQIHNDLEKVVGPQITVNPAADLFSGVGAVVNWRVRGLIPDAQTQGEISSGKPPTYQVAIDTAGGQTELVRDPGGKPLRYRFDAEAAKQAALPALRARDKASRDAKAFNDPYQGMTGPM